MELGPGFAGDLGDPSLDDRVDVLILGQDLDGSLMDLRRHHLERSVELRALLRRQDASGDQSVNVRMASRDVISRQIDVVVDRHRQGGELWCHPGLEAAMPERHAWPPCLLAQVATPRPHSRTKPSASW